jgi:hypothetical protein
MKYPDFVPGWCRNLEALGRRMAGGIDGATNREAVVFPSGLISADGEIHPKPFPNLVELKVGSASPHSIFLDFYARFPNSARRVLSPIREDDGLDISAQR